MLNDDEQQTQKDIREAYRWVMKVAEEIGALLADASRMISSRGFDDAEGLRSGFGQKVPPDTWPFVYYLVRMYNPLEKDSSEMSAFLAIVPYNPHLDEGPKLFCGAIRGHHSEVKHNHFVVWDAACDPEERKRFKASGGAVRISQPTDIGREKYKGVQDVTWFAVPLAWISSAERLERIVEAVVDVTEGRLANAENLVKETGGQ